MSTPVINVVNDAALEIGDPDKTRISLPHWLSIYNRANRELCAKVNLLRYSDDFDIVAGQQQYDYPESMVTMTGLQVSETPDDETTFRVVREIFEDEFRAMTDSLYPSESLPRFYFANSAWFNLVGTATDDILDGGIITYFSLPDDIGYNEMINGYIEIPDFGRDYLMSRMVIYAMEARNRWAEAASKLQIWEADTDSLQDKLQDRSDDRRSSLAPRRHRMAGMR